MKLTCAGFVCSTLSSSAVYIPPKLEQGFNQGGTFVFDGADTIFAHYDESVGDHADIETVINLAKDRISAKDKQSADNAVLDVAMN